MSAYIRTTSLLNAAAGRSMGAAAATQRMGLRTSAPMWAGKETALHHEGRAEEAEAAKQESLRKAKEGKGEWKDTLASDSESIIKADRGEAHENTDEVIKKLQEETKKVSKK